MTTALGKVCNACHVERKRRTVLYDPETFLPYCEHPYICNDDHPNSPKNIVARGGDIKLIAYEEAQAKFTDWLALNQPDKEKAATIRRMVVQPTTIRIGSPELAQFIIDLQADYGFPSVSETIRFCVQQMKEAKHAYYHEYRKLADEKAVKERIEQAVQSVDQPAVSATTLDKPKVIEPESEELVF